MSYLSRLLSDFGMLVVLVLLCVFLTFATWSKRRPEGAAGGRQVAEQLSSIETPRQVLVVVGNHAIDRSFVEAFQESKSDRITVLRVIHGEPADARKAIEESLSANKNIDVIVCSSATAGWDVFSLMRKTHPKLRDTQIVSPRSYYWSNFLTSQNLLNVANQIAVIAIIAVGMTMVVITGGIDLSVGSLVALSAVVIARLIRDYGGAENATPFTMLLAGGGAIVLCAAAGLFSGAMVTLFRSPPSIPPFIVTLGMMLIASGSAYLIASGQSINRVPDSFTWLGRDASLGSIPNAVVVMILVYISAHALMTRTTLGRYIYAVGGNSEAARLSGIDVRRVLLFVYAASGTLAGLGGVMLASQLKAGAPTYGLMYELYVIAAVVVGGTSLAGGEGRVMGTLVGAFIIAVIQNGMNLLGLESYTQKVVLGSVILLAVLIDRLKKQIS